MNPIYLDYNATTPLDPAVKDALITSLENFGNPSSSHSYGKTAHQALDVEVAFAAYTSGSAQIAASNAGRPESVWKYLRCDGNPEQCSKRSRIVTSRRSLPVQRGRCADTRSRRSSTER